MPRAATLAALIALAFSVAAHAQDLWNGASAGMTLEQVRGTIPVAGQGQLIDRGGDQVLRVTNLRAGGHDAVAMFDFASGGLRSVELRLSPGPGESSLEPDTVRSQLISKYGPPAACGADDDRCDWQSRSTDITLLGPRSTQGGSVTIVYRPSEQYAEGAQEPRVTPVSVVRAFYADLTRGDGADAARLVIPVKRERGHLSAAALTGFYSTLPGPIHLTAAWPRSDDDVFVRYQFIAGGGRLCDGSADVRTTRAGDQVLIDAIRAYGGC